MLWPEGSASVVAGLGSYLQPRPTDEDICTFCVSKAGAYLAMASKSVLALFRLRPLTPLAIYPAFFPETEIIQIVSSHRGNYLAVLTADNRIAVFSVQPQKDIEEVLKVGYVITPGPGEAIGARELWLEPLNTIQPEQKVVKLGAIGPLLVAYTDHHVHVVDWHAFKSKDPLKPPALRLLDVGYFADRPDDAIANATVGIWAKDEWISCVLTRSNRAVVLHLKGLAASTVAVVSASALPLANITAVDYNIRMGKLALVVNANRVFVLAEPLLPHSEPVELPSDAALTINAIQWAPAGTALLLLCNDGWLLSSALGLTLYHHQDKAAADSGAVGTVHGEWLPNADGLVLLDSRGQLHLHNMLRWSGNHGSDRTRPLLHGNGRLMVYHAPSARGVQASSVNGGSGSQMWVTVPLPTWYMAQSWPLAHVCSSPDGRYVAISGTIGIMLFSLVTRQWKELGDRDSMVHGGLCWHGRRLVAATQSADDGMTVLKMFSPVNVYHQKSASNGATMQPPSSPTRGAQATRDSRPSLDASSSSPHAQTSDAPAASAHSSANGPGSAALSQLSALPSSASVATLNMGSSSEQQVIAKDVLGSGPGSVVTLMSKGPHNLLAVLVGDTARLLIYDLSHNEFDLIRDIPLAGILPGSRPAPAVRALSLVDERRVLVLVGTSLVLISSIDESRKYQRQTVAEPIETFTYLASEELLCVFDGQEMVITTWPSSASSRSSSTAADTRNSSDSLSTIQQTPENVAAGSSLSEHTSSAGTNGASLEDDPDATLSAKPKQAQAHRTYLTSIPLDAYPVHISPNRGVLALVEAEPIRSYDGSFMVARPVTSQEVYIPYVLEAALTSAFDKAVDLASKYSKMTYFSGVLETLLYRAVTNDEEADVVKLALELIGQFQNDANVALIIAGCARKVDVKYWSRLFGAVGKSAGQLFDESLTRGDLETASEFLLVVQTTEKQGTPEFEAASLAGLQLDGRTLRLYRAALAAGKVWICREICEFLLAVDETGGALKHLRESAAVAA